MTLTTTASKAYYEETFSTPASHTKKVQQLEVINDELSNLKKERSVFIGYSAGKVFLLAESKSQLKSDVRKEISVFQKKSRATKATETCT